MLLHLLFLLFLHPLTPPACVLMLFFSLPLFLPPQLTLEVAVLVKWDAPAGSSVRLSVDVIPAGGFALRETLEMAPMAVRESRKEYGEALEFFFFCACPEWQRKLLCGGVSPLPFFFS
jgi:hypothetical protein